MHGKSCFSFKAVDNPLAKELEELTAAGLKSFQAFVTAR
jgi:hypothetical protein